MFKKVLIANRGEIALRVIHACRELGVETVAVHSTADEDSLHVIYADDAVCIGPPKSADSYLNKQRIIAAAEITGADAVHPGYGFLSEKADFATMLRECNLAWIGPEPETIELMGDKAKARQTAQAAGVPVLPGSEEPLAGVDDALALADEVGFPIILKASAGGGGRGMRIVWERDELATQFNTASTEALAAFGDGSVYMEKYLQEPRHIEFQVFADHYGNVIHLGERECSIQRRHQKLVEEAPSPALDDELRARMGAAAVQLTKAVNYRNAGTIEFLLDKNGDFYFMEMNTRIQVEHPVTELVAGVDLVRMQLEIASGGRLSLESGLPPQGHSIEVRVNAEDPENFRPSPGKIEVFHTPGGPGVRVDTHGYEDYVIPPHYDSLVAKLIVHDVDRPSAIARMKRALSQFEIRGIKTSIPLHREIMEDEDFASGEMSTKFMERFFEKKASGS
ncbi:MAG: acetyl-CoA carboxylase biotin carboxylase subunit [Acidobacteriota bacterium]